MVFPLNIKNEQTQNRNGLFKIFVWPTFGPADFNQIDHILMFEQLKYLDFPQSCDWELQRARHQPR